MLGDFGVAGLTPEYAAPELIQGGPKSAATDLWAVAATFYELLCGEPPFGQPPDLDEPELAARIAACAYTHPDERLPYLPLRFRNFFRGSLESDAAQRSYATVAAMRNELRELGVCVEWARIKRDDCHSAASVRVARRFGYLASGPRAEREWPLRLAQRPAADRRGRLEGHETYCC